jgi:hypothetical protein
MGIENLNMKVVLLRISHGIMLSIIAILRPPMHGKGKGKQLYFVPNLSSDSILHIVFR